MTTDEFYALSVGSSVIAIDDIYDSVGNCIARRGDVGSFVEFSCRDHAWFSWIGGMAVVPYWLVEVCYE